MVIREAHFAENLSHFRFEPTSAEREYAIAVYERLLRFGMILRGRYEIAFGIGSCADKVVNRFERLQRRGSIEFRRGITAVYVVVFVICGIAFGIEFIPKSVEEPIHVVDGKSARERSDRSARSVVFDFCRLYGFAQVYKSLNGARPFAFFIFAERVDFVKIGLVVDKPPARIYVTREIRLIFISTHIYYMVVHNSRFCGSSVFSRTKNVVDRLDRSVSYPLYPVIHRMSDEIQIFLFGTGVVHEREQVGNEFGIGRNVNFDSRFFIVRRSNVFYPFRAESFIYYFNVNVAAARRISAAAVSALSAACDKR